MLMKKRVCFIGTPQKIYMSFRNNIMSLEWKDIISVESDGDNQRGSVFLKYTNKNPIRNFVMHTKICALVMFKIQGAKEIEEICKKRYKSKRLVGKINENHERHY
ncbi:MAG: hypothetical protein MNSN_08600 [Minisyncoccus archaeiphilus]|nr:MAG: hypothetical protein MNSN_08600 [Candidatus Parcubacteria bacterium]